MHLSFRLSVHHTLTLLTWWGFSTVRDVSVISFMWLLSALRVFIWISRKISRLSALYAYRTMIWFCQTGWRLGNYVVCKKKPYLYILSPFIRFLFSPSHPILKSGPSLVEMDHFLFRIHRFCKVMPTALKFFQNTWSLPWVQKLFEAK